MRLQQQQEWQMRQQQLLQQQQRLREEQKRVAAEEEQLAMRQRELERQQQHEEQQQQQKQTRFSKVPQTAQDNTVGQADTGDYEVVKNGFRYTLRRKGKPADGAAGRRFDGGLEIEVDDDGNRWQPGGIWVGEKDKGSNDEIKGRDVGLDEHAEAILVFGDYIRTCC
jgi:septal ring factor EnvC (AmiA/AmiB activator)